MFSCTKCDAQFPKWSGRCSECQGWGTLKESEETEIVSQKNTKSKSTGKVGILLSQEKSLAQARISSGETEVDRVLGGGIVPGSLILLSGEPGVGKSTLVAQIAAGLQPDQTQPPTSNSNPSPACPAEAQRRGARRGGQGEDRFVLPPPSPSLGFGGAGQPSPAVAAKEGDSDGFVLYISGEESAGQLATRFERLGKKFDRVKYLEVEPVETIIASIENEKPILAIIDSIQTVGSLDLDSAAGSPNMVRYATNLLLQCAKQTNIPIMIIGQVTKDGSVAGPKTLEHLVDTVLSLEGDPVHAFRILRATKNRFGSTDEVGVFEMAKIGLVAVPNPSERFLAERQNSPGSVITAALEGSRVFLIEVQALVEKSFYPSPVRRASGFDVNRLQMLSTILSSRAGLNLGDKDIYVNVIGGMELKEPAADLAVCAAIVSAVGGGARGATGAKGEPVVYFGEVGLGGEVRSVLGAERRLNEVARIGLKRAAVPQKNVGEVKTMEVVGVKSVREL